MSEAFTYSELAEILPLSRATIQSLTRKGVLPAERRGRKTYISRASVEAFLQRCMTLVRPQQEEVVDVVIDVDVDEARQHRRFLLKTPLAAKLTTTDAKIIDIDEHGVRICHERALRIGSEGRFSFELDGLQRVWVVRARVTWSKLASGGYVSGLVITENDQAMRDAIACLERLDAVEPDRTSLQQKRETRQRKDAARAAMRSVPRQDLEQGDLIRATMEQLRRDPVAAQRWYSRAHYALAQESVRRLLPTRQRERDESLAIWEALDRRVDLRVVCRIVATERG